MRRLPPRGSATSPADGDWPPPPGLCAPTAPDWAVVVVLPRLATLLCAGPPPQEATTKLRLTSTHITAARRLAQLACLPSVASPEVTTETGVRTLGLRSGMVGRTIPPRTISFVRRVCPRACGADRRMPRGLSSLGTVLAAPKTSNVSAPGTFPHSARCRWLAPWLRLLRGTPKRSGRRRSSRLGEAHGAATGGQPASCEAPSVPAGGSDGEHTVEITGRSGPAL